MGRFFPSGVTACRRSSSTAVFRTSLENGLANTLDAPRNLAARRMFVGLWWLPPEIAMIFNDGFVLRSEINTSSPSFSGISMSAINRSAPSAEYIRSPSLPLFASITVWPKWTSMSRSAVRTASSSSIRRILAICSGVCGFGFSSSWRGFGVRRRLKMPRRDDACILMPEYA